MGSTATTEDAPHSPSIAEKDVRDELRISENGSKQREVEEVQNGTPDVISAEAAGGRVGPDQEEVLLPASVPGQKRKRNKKERGVKRRNSKEGTEEAKAEETTGNADSVSMVSEETDAFADNIVLKKLLRWPRYFDLENYHSETCYNCGEQGHLVKDCSAEKRKRPCFLCGLFGHAAKTCTLGVNCYICSKSGHIAKDCPDKHKKISRSSNICLRCGNFGHDMFFCTNEYSPKDLQEIQCYICNKFGHLCCYEVSINSGQVSCYNCGQSGHTGVGCAKTRKEKGEADSLSTCYVCGEEGHFARGCTKKHPRRQKDESTDQASKKKKEKRKVGPNSAPPEYHRPQRKKHRTPVRDGWNFTPARSRIKGGWIVDDPGDYIPYNKFRGNKWASPLTLYRNGRSPSFSAEERYSQSRYPCSKPRVTSSYPAEQYLRTPKSYDAYHQHGSGSKSRRKYWRS